MIRKVYFILLICFCLTANAYLFKNFKKALVLGISSIYIGAEIILPTNANAADEIITVIGAGGKTGKIITNKLLKDHKNVRPVYRSQTTLEDNIRTFTGDVTRAESLDDAIKGADVVIFAASASKNGGNAASVDNNGLYNTALESIKFKVPKLVVISSGAITRPNSLAFKFTNLFGGIMDQKLQGEQRLIEEYNANGNNDLSYVIIRPGGLMDGESAGEENVTINQGDAVAGDIDRTDVAEAAIAAAYSKSIPRNVIFEMYQKGKGAQLEKNLKVPTGYERDEKTYEQKFANLKSGVIKIP
jgi:hypothetical protein